MILLEGLDWTVEVVKPASRKLSGCVQSFAQFRGSV